MENKALNSNSKINTLQVAVSTQNLTSDAQVENLLNNMNIKNNYLIINQTSKNNIEISNSNVITKNEKGLSKSRNIAIDSAKEDIVLIADDDVIYNDEYEKIILDSWKKYKEADIICFYVESKNPKRPTKKIKTGRIRYIKAMRIASFEISFKKDIIKEKNIKFNENFGAGTELNRGEEQIFLYEALKKNLKIIFVNKQIATVKQEESSWFKNFDERFFTIQGKVFKQMSKKFYFWLCLQYAIRKYFLYKNDISFFRALKCMLYN
jgi:glycosyltransferase involved in cell wall biosynthesis